MKFKNIIFAITAIAGLGFLAACGGKTTDTASKPKPTVTFKTGAGYTSASVTSHVDSIVKMGIIALSNDASLSEVKITLSVNGSVAGSVKDTMISSKSLNFDYLYKVTGSAGDVQTITVIATDKNGESASVSLKISINPETKSLGITANQKVNNIQGPSQGAYDLNNSTNVVGVTTDPAILKLQDLKDMTTVAGGAVFSKAWTSGNGSKFVRVLANDWTNATSTDYVFNLWKTNSATAATTISNIAVGDIILVKSGQAVPFNYYIIKVTQVYVTATAGDNNDYIQFDFKSI